MNYKNHTRASPASRSLGGVNRRTQPAGSRGQGPSRSSSRSTASGGMLSSILSFLGSLLRWFGPVLVTGGVIGAALLYAVWEYTGLPTVYESYATRECVKVEYVDGSLGDCSDLPKRYHHMWVQ